MSSGMADLRCRHCGKRFGFPYRAPLPASVNCPHCDKANDTTELANVLSDLGRIQEQSVARGIVDRMKQAGLNLSEIACRIGIPERRVRPFLIGASTLTDDEFKTVSAALHLPVPFRSPTTKQESHAT